jgi:hypothetical protein
MLESTQTARPLPSPTEAATVTPTLFPTDTPTPLPPETPLPAFTFTLTATVEPQRYLQGPDGAEIQFDWKD